MGAIDQIVQVNITANTQAVPQVGFGTPLVLGPTGFPNSDLIRYYSSAASMLAPSEGFTTSDPEYIYVSKAFSQELKPQLVGVGKRLPRVAQIDTVTPTAVNSFLYTVTLNGTDFTFMSDGSATVSEIVAGLVAAINGGSEPVTASGSTTLILTADVAGVSFVTAVGANLVNVHTTANHQISDDIAAILNVSTGNNWYGLAICSNVDADILSASAFIETVKKIFIGVTDNADVLTTATDDIVSQLKDRSYERSASIWTAQANQGIEAGLMGGNLPRVPGSYTMMFKTVIGSVADFLTDTQQLNVIGVPGIPAKNGNIYTTVGGLPIIREGWMAGGTYIDQTIGIDWLSSEIQVNVFGLLINSPKVPYTNAGTLLIEAAILKAITDGIENGLIDGDSPFGVTIPKVLDESANDRANRILRDAKFFCRFAGALHHVIIDGTVTV